MVIQLEQRPWEKPPQKDGVVRNSFHCAISHVEAENYRLVCGALISSGATFQPTFNTDVTVDKIMFTWWIWTSPGNSRAGEESSCKAIWQGRLFSKWQTMHTTHTKHRTKAVCSSVWTSIFSLCLEIPPLHTMEKQIPPWHNQTEFPIMWLEIERKKSNI